MFIDQLMDKRSLTIGYPSLVSDPARQSWAWTSGWKPRSGLDLSRCRSSWISVMSDVWVVEELVVNRPPTKRVQRMGGCLGTGSNCPVGDPSLLCWERIRKEACRRLNSSRKERSMFCTFKSCLQVGPLAHWVTQTSKQA